MLLNKPNSEEQISLEAKQILNEIIDKIINKLEHKTDSTDEEEEKELNVFETECNSCNTKISPFWRRVARNKIVCNKCFFNKTYLITISDEQAKKQSIDKTKTSKKSFKRPINTQLSSSSSETTDKKQEDDQKNTRKSTRFLKTKPNLKTKKSEQKEPSKSEQDQAHINRRSKLFKKNPPIRHETIESTILTSEYVIHRGFYMQIGDIVALFDVIDKDMIYFAQIRAFLTDQFGAKSAVITWLIPSHDLKIKTIQEFDPNCFALGPAEEYPRSLDYMEFVCRLTDLAGKQRTDDIVRSSLQYKNDLLRHKFSLEDLASTNLKLISKRTMDEHQNIEYEIKT